ncbi:hypothetical protein [Neobacillus sp. NPDC093127]|uniref:hypothetical protein n=1 Tax=Neobacillus sp. NPDC093127 TaxID=3364296 RepID=UPI003805F2FC
MDEKRESNAGELKVKIDVDCSEALKGLKAVTRAAKKATAALKELDDAQRKVSSISITVDGKAIGGILTEHSEFARRVNAQMKNTPGF